MTLGVARWRLLLAPWHAQLKAAQPSSHFDIMLGYRTRFPHLPPAAWREFVRRCRELAELVQTLVVAEQVSLADALKTLQSTSDEWPRPPVLPPYVLQHSPPAASARRDHRAAERSLLVTLGHDVIGPQANKDRGADVVELAAVYFAFDERAASPAFRAAMHEVYSALAPAARRRLREQAPLALKFTFTMKHKPPGADAALYLRSIGDLARLLLERSSAAAAAVAPRDASDPHWRFRFPFTLASVQVMDVDELPAHPRGVSTALAELLALGVGSYDSLDLGPGSWFMTTPISELAPVLRGIVDAASLRALLGVKRRLPAAAGRTLQLTDYRSSPNAASRSERARLRQLGAALSAFSVTRDLRTVTMWLSCPLASPEGGERLLKWLTYALFSKDAAASSVTRLEIDIGFAKDDAAGIARVLGARNPAKALLDTTMVTVVPTAPSRGPLFVRGIGRGRGGRGRGGRAAAALPAPAQSPVTRAPVYVEIIDDEDEEDRDLGFAVVRAGTPVVVKPLDGPNEQATDAFVLPQDGRFRVMRDASGSDWIDIVVPYYGHCVVARTGVEHFDLSLTSDSSLAIGYTGSITSLKLGHYESMVLLPLVTFAGPKLLNLEIKAEVTNDDIAQIVRACPNLVALGLRRTAEEVDDVFIDAYESGRCKIESLALDGFFTEEYAYHYDGRPAGRFIRALQDPASRVAKTLRNLVLFEARFDAIDGRFLAAVTRMLASNRTLEYLSFSVVDYIFEEFEPQLMATNGMKLPDRPLDPSQKCAFLSVVRHFSASASAEPPRKRARQATTTGGGGGGGGGGVAVVDFDRLDPLVTSLIFEFAARPGGIRHLQITGYDGENTPPER